MAEGLNINQFTSAVNQLINSIPRETLAINTKLALNAIPKITNRLIDEGQTAEGKSLGKYSTRPLSPLMLIPQASGKGATNKIYTEVKRNKKAGRPTGISYERFRELNNLPTEHVTLSFTGETLGDIGVIEQNVNGRTVNVVVGSRGSKSKDIYDKRGRKTGTKTTEDILEDLDEKYGQALDTELLSLAPDEIADLQFEQDRLLQQLVDKFLR